MLTARGRRGNGSTPPVVGARGRTSGEGDGDDRRTPGLDQFDTRRLRGERGTAIITVTVLLFTVTFGSIVYLSRDVNRVVSHRSAAQSIAFQSARAGAQQVRPGSLRNGGGEVVELDEFAAREEAIRVGNRLFSSYGVAGAIRSTDVVVRGDTVTVTATVTDPNGDASATGSVQAQTGP